MSHSEGTSLPASIVMKFVLNVAMVWAMSLYIPETFIVTASTTAYITVGALLTLMNIIVRPILNLLTIPLKLFTTLLAIIAVQMGFLALTVHIVSNMDPAIVQLRIENGLAGWLFIAIILGIGNWIVKLIAL